MRKRSSKGGGAQRSIQVHLMVNEEEAAMIRAAARKRNQTVSLTIIEAVKLLFLVFCFGCGYGCFSVCVVLLCSCGLLLVAYGFLALLFVSLF